jgi:hypothetical protein
MFIARRHACAAPGTVGECFRGDDMSSEEDQRQVLYERYHAVDDFRMKLLGLLPVATGTGVFLLLNSNAELLGDDGGQVSNALLAIGIVGFLFTLGLFAYELFGIKKCHYLIVAGQQLEVGMRLPGQFRTRPRELAGFINEPFASAIIYPACMAAWAFLALSLKSTLAAPLVAGVVFLIGYNATRFGARRIKENQEREDLVLEIVLSEDRPMTFAQIREAVGRKVWEDAARRDARRSRRPEPTGLTGRLYRLARWLPGTQTNGSPRQPQWVDPAVERLEQRGDLTEADGQLRPTSNPVRRLTVSQVEKPSLDMAAVGDSGSP